MSIYEKYLYEGHLVYFEDITLLNNSSPNTNGASGTSYYGIMY